jgi:hypothetical protein
MSEPGERVDLCLLWALGFHLQQTSLSNSPHYGGMPIPWITFMINASRMIYRIGLTTKACIMYIVSWLLIYLT